LDPKLQLQIRIHSLQISSSGSDRIRIQQTGLNNSKTHLETILDFNHRQPKKETISKAVELEKASPHTLDLITDGKRQKVFSLQNSV